MQNGAPTFCLNLPPGTELPATEGGTDMFVISVFYPPPESGSFDFAYYTGTHTPMVQRLWGGLGLQEIRILKGINGPDGNGPTYVVVTSLTFESAEAFQAAAAQHGTEIFADIPNFTSTPPVLQFNQRLG